MVIRSLLGVKISAESTGFGVAYYSNFPNIWVASNAVNIEDLEEEMLPVLKVLDGLGLASNAVFVITSGKDSGHSENSYHYQGKAIDISFMNAELRQAISGWTDQGIIYQQFRSLLNPVPKVKTTYDIVWEADHVHVEYDPHLISKVSETSKAVKSVSEATGSVTSKQVSEEQLIAYFHTDPTITSLNDLIAQNPIFKGMKSAEVESLKGTDGLTNKQRIEKTYNNPDEEAEEKEEWPLLKPGTLLYIKPSKANLDSLPMESVNQVKKFRKWGEYQSSTQKELNTLEGYRPSYWGSSKDYKFAYPIKYINSFFRVWIYCKSIQEILDITQFCNMVKLKTDMSNNDTFTLSLAFFHAKQNEEKYQDVIHINPFEENKIAWLSRTITENDLVFISMEQLDCEDGRPVHRDSVEKEILANQYYDFIGLVSNISQYSDTQGQANVQITGESVSKIFNRDEAVFRPIAALEDSFAGSIIIGDRKKRGWMQRMFVDSQYHSLFTESMRTIERTMKFYLNMVSNVGLLPFDEEVDLFSSWGRNRTELYSIEYKDTIKEVKTGFAKGLYQIIKLQVQPELERRHLSDGSVCNPQGTIMSLMQAVCQRPLVELVMDTYKNTFDVICRVPPFNRQALIEWIETEQASNVSGNNFGDIEVEDVLEENLAFETDFYTWFELRPKGSIIPLEGELEALCYIPTLFLAEFIETWGSRCLSVVSPYSVTGGLQAVTSEEIEQAIHDLCWIVESYFYLPFTRKGTITLVVPDRRIKKGQWIRYKKTGELFYVEGVEQTAAVSSNMVTRQTVLTVSRGLVEKYVNTKQKNGYFDIIDFKALEESLKGFSSKGGSSVSHSAVVNGDLFKFFLSKRQFER